MALPGDKATEIDRSALITDLLPPQKGQQGITAPAPPTSPATERQRRVVNPVWAATFIKRCIMILRGLSPFDLWSRAVLRI